MIFAVDIGGTRIKAARVTAEGRIEASRAIPSPATLDQFRSAARELAAGLGQGCTGCGIGCKGNIESTTTRVITLPGTLHYLEGQRLSELFGIEPAIADNDARIALHGEHRWGAAKGCDDVLMVTLGTGVGGGVISGGQVLRGFGGAAGHIGHLTVDSQGALCICGNRGCLETVFSARALESAVHSAFQRGVRTSMQPPPSCEQLFAAAHHGDPLARSILTPAIATLAGALAGLCFVLDPQVLVIGGQIAEAGEALFAPLRAQIHERTLPFLQREIPLVPAQVSDGVLGAAALSLETRERLAQHA
jgi:glucokinase